MNIPNKSRYDNISMRKRNTISLQGGEKINGQRL